MRKQLLALSLILVMLLGITAQASGPAMLPAAQPSLSFSGTTASCRIIVRGDRSSDTLSATAKLWTGKTCLKTWTIKGTGKIQTTKTATVSKGIQADRGLHCQRRQAAPEVCDKNLFVTTQRIVIFSPVVVKPHGMDYKLKGGIFYEKKTFIRNIVVSFCFLYGDISIRLCRWN